MDGPKAGRILYLALADARGHLMRAHILRGLLGPHGIEVDILTTSREGQAFLAALGTPSEVLSVHFKVAFDRCHDMSRARTDVCVARYLASPSRALRDLGRLRARARGADLVVNDSLHPALLIAPFVPGPRMRIVHVFGENIWAAAEQNFEGRGPRAWQELYTWGIRKMRDAAFACIMHTLSARPEGSQGARTLFAPPIVPVPSRTPAEVRLSLGVAKGERLAAVYLNPHFTDPRVATAVERSLASHGYRMHAVGEGYDERPGWIARDGDFASVVRAADVLVSGAGMGALGQSRLYGTPLVSLLGNQPEQVRNAAAVRASERGDTFGTVLLAPTLAGLEGDLHAEIGRVAALRAQPDTVAREGGSNPNSPWIEAFFQLINEARKDQDREIIVRSSARSRDQQPAWRDGAGRNDDARHPRARRNRGAPRAPAGADVFARAAEGARRHA